MNDHEQDRIENAAEREMNLMDRAHERECKHLRADLSSLAQRLAKAQGDCRQYEATLNEIADMTGTAGVDEPMVVTDCVRAIVTRLSQAESELKSVKAEAARLAGECGKGPLKFSTLNIANVRRAERWHKGGLDEWSVNDWLTAFGGEAGEALNAGKKHRRLLSKIQQHGDVPADLDAAVEHIMDELADTVIYADLVAARLGRRLSDAIVRKFNAISEREGFPDRLPDGMPHPASGEGK